MEENHAPWIGVGALVIVRALSSMLPMITKKNQFGDKNNYEKY